MSRAVAATDMVDGAGLSDRAVRLFSVAAALGVANIYYAQPLLHAMAVDLQVPQSAAAQVATATTVGYTVGLALVVPLGDMVDRRRLVVGLLSGVAATAAPAALAPGLTWLLVLSALMALSAVVAPVLVSFGASLASAGQRGAVTGRIVSGVLVGVLLARVGAGLVAEVVGTWRAVYAFAAAAMAVLAVVMVRVLPSAPVVDGGVGYRRLLASTVTILAEEPVLRRRCAYGFVSFAGFNLLWVSTTFLLGGPAYGYGTGVIGLVGLLGVAGVLAASLVGRAIDRGRERRATPALLTLILLSWGVMALDAGRWLPVLLLGILVLDIGVQGVQVANLSVIYRSRPEARNRITMVYTATYFAGGSLGAALAPVAQRAGGWLGVCLLGAGFAAAGLMIGLVDLVRPRCCRPAA